MLERVREARCANERRKCQHAGTDSLEEFHLGSESRTGVKSAWRSINNKRSITCLIMILDMICRKKPGLGRSACGVPGISRQSFIREWQFRNKRPSTSRLRPGDAERNEKGAKRCEGDCFMMHSAQTLRLVRIGTTLPHGETIHPTITRRTGTSTYCTVN